MSHDLLTELEKFEKEFAVFIQRKETFQYYERARNTIEDLLFHQNAMEHATYIKNLHIILDVFDFNYSLNFYDANHWLNLNSKIALHSWTNIHGIADYNRNFNKKIDGNIPAPIFGFDLYEMLDSKLNRLYKN